MLTRPLIYGAPRLPYIERTTRQRNRTCFSCTTGRNYAFVLFGGPLLFFFNVKEHIFPHFLRSERITRIANGLRAFLSYVKQYLGMGKR